MEKLDVLKSAVTELETTGGEALTVPEMMDALCHIVNSVRKDECLADLAEPVRSILKELAARRRMAQLVAEQSDAEKTRFKN